MIVVLLMGWAEWRNRDNKPRRVLLLSAEMRRQTLCPGCPMVSYLRCK